MPANASRGIFRRLDFGIPRFLLLELLQRLDRFITGAERAPGALAVFIETNFEEEEFGDLLEALVSGNETMMIAAARQTSARINEALRLDWMEE